MNVKDRPEMKGTGNAGENHLEITVTLPRQTNISIAASSEEMAVFMLSMLTEYTAKNLDISFKEMLRNMVLMHTITDHALDERIEIDNTLLKGGKP